MTTEIKNQVALSSLKSVAAPVDSASVNSNNNANVKLSVQVAKTDTSHSSSPTLATIKAATEQGNQFLQSTKLSVEYSVDSATKETVIKVVDSGGKLVRQIPSAEMLDFVKRLEDMEDKQKGTVIQTSA